MPRARRTDRQRVVVSEAARTGAPDALQRCPLIILIQLIQDIAGHLDLFRTGLAENLIE